MTVMERNCKVCTKPAKRHCEKNPRCDWWECLDCDAYGNDRRTVVREHPPPRK